MGANLEDVGRDAPGSQELVVGHEHQRGIVRKPALNALERLKVLLQEALRHFIIVCDAFPKKTLLHMPWI